MPQQVIVNGKPCIEYSPQELDAIRLELEIKRQLKNGRFSRAKSVFNTTLNLNPTGKVQPR